MLYPRLGIATSPGGGRPSSGRKSLLGLSVPELLVVVAILAIIVALLFPALRSIRESSMQAHCLNNLRQIGNAFLMYVGENDGWLPIVRDRSDPGTQNFRSYGAWYWHLAPYLDVETVEGRNDRIAPVRDDGGLPRNLVYFCPAQPEANEWNEFRRMHRPISYAPTILVVNPGPGNLNQISEDGDGVFRGRMQRISQPSRKVFIGESPNGDALWNMTGDSRWTVEETPLNIGYRGFTRHNGWGNVLFFDGHVESFEADYLRQLHIDDRDAFNDLFNPWIE